MGTKEKAEAGARRKKLHCNLKESYSVLLENEFEAQRILCKRMSHLKHHPYLDRVEKDIKNDPKRFWNFVDIKNVQNRGISKPVY